MTSAFNTFPVRSFSRWFRGGRLLSPLFVVVALTISGCSSKNKYPVYTPHENLLSIATEFQLLSAQNPYRETVGRDLMGQSIPKATLVRLANFESENPDRLRPEILTLKARALELLGDYVSAQRNYQEAAEFDTPLKKDCLRRSDELAKLIIISAPKSTPQDIEGLLKAVEDQAAEFRKASEFSADEFYGALAAREAETLEVQHAELIVANMQFFPDGAKEAGKALELVFSRNRQSARAVEHMLRIAQFHRRMAEQIARINPPETAGFSSSQFQEHYGTATNLLYQISQMDGKPERLIAKHDLDALLAFGEQVQARMK